MQLTKPFSRGVVIWDTDWDEPKKLEVLDANTPDDHIGLLTVAGRKIADPAVARDLDFIVARIRSNGFDTWTRSNAHSLRNRLRDIGRDDDVRAVEVVIRGKVAAVAPHASHSQLKTPSGNTRALHVNYTTRDDGTRFDTEYQHVEFFVRCAEELGFRLHIFTTEQGSADLGSAGLLGGAGVEVLRAAYNPAKWAEDSVEFLVSGQVAVLEKFVPIGLAEGLTAGRRQRWAGLISDPAHQGKPFDRMRVRDWVPEGLSVNSSPTGDDRARAVEAAGAGPVRRLRFYGEGGNLVTGDLADGRVVVLVGRDAIAATRAEYFFTDDDDVLRIIAEDFGLETGQVVPVEQPGKFHLDMGLMFVGQGRVVLNDCRAELEAARGAVADGGTDTELVAKLELRSGLEALARADLERAGLEVRQVTLEAGWAHNFFNGEFVTGQDGKAYFLTNGTANAEAKTALEALLVQELGVVAGIRYSPVSAAAKSLAEQGGVGCRAKGSQ
ncbi:hypothetical protein AB0H12_21755 [Actinosynnema sp. NPDC023794]